MGVHFLCKLLVSVLVVISVAELSPGRTSAEAELTAGVDDIDSVEEGSGVDDIDSVEEGSGADSAEETLPETDPVIVNSSESNDLDYIPKVTDDSSSFEDDISEEEEEETENGNILTALVNRTDYDTDELPNLPTNAPVSTTAHDDPSHDRSVQQIFSLALSSSDSADTVFTFAGQQPYVEIVLPQFKICPSYHLSLQFRSDRPHGLLAFLMQDGSTQQRSRMHQYLYIRNGHLAVRTVVGGKRNTFLTDKGGLQDGAWHSVSLRVSCEDGRIELTLDQEVQEVFTNHQITKLRANQDTTATPVLWVGGVPNAPEQVQPLLTVKQFHGCIKNMHLYQDRSEDAAANNPSAAAAVVQEEVSVPLKASKHNGVQAGPVCVNKCLKSNPCPEGNRCINHFCHASCDCSKTGTTGPHCEKKDDSVISFKGDGFLSHKLYQWKDRVKKNSFKLALDFKTNTLDSLLFFARAQPPSSQTLSLVLDAAGRLRLGGSLDNLETNTRVEVDGVDLDLSELPDRAVPFSGEQEATQLETSKVLSDKDWHHIVLTYTTTQPEMIDLEPEVYFGYYPQLNEVCHQTKLPGDLRCQDVDDSTPGTVYSFDSSTGVCDILNYTGCGGNQNRFLTQEECLQACHVAGLHSYKPFIGCMKQLYVEGSNILESLELETGHTVYSGQLSDRAACHMDNAEVVSFTTPRSHAVVPSSHSPPNTAPSLQLSFKLKRLPKGEDAQGIIAMGKVEMAETITRWGLHHSGDYVYFKLENDLLNIKSASKLNKGAWNEIRLITTQSTVKLLLNSGDAQSTTDIPFNFVSGVTLGSPIAAMVGCMKNVQVNGVPQDLRQFLSRSNGIVFDGCKVEGPCDVAGCLHGGQCSLSDEGAVRCDCADTGYEGSKCQFAQYQRSCEEYRYRHGFNTSGRYLVDTDGPGPVGPVPIFCRFLITDTVTELDHNVPGKYIVRKKGIKTHKVAVSYHDLPADQLTHIVQSSFRCQQSVTFDCIRARLRLSSETWFTSPQMKLNSYFGTDTPGICPCKANDVCDKSDVPCNCDIDDGVRRRDSALLTEARQLPVTGLVFLAVKEGQHKHSKATLTLGNLTCYNQVEPSDAVSLLNSASFLEVPSSSAKLRNLGFAFRTAASTATLLYKPSFRPSQPEYRITLRSANVLEFEYYHLHSNQSVVFHTPYLLNTAAWQHIWVDFSDEEIRIALNGRKEYLNIVHQNEALDGEIYLGGTPSDLLGALHPTSDTPGLIGCLRHLTLSDERVSMQDLLQTSPTQDFNIGCSLSCDPNPCRNDATCLEAPLGGYKCICANQYAEWGQNCQHSLNDNAVTILNPYTELRYTDESYPRPNGIDPRTQDITFSFHTREIQGMLLLVLDHLQNLVQIYMASPNEVSVIWNTAYTLHHMSINTGDLTINQGHLVQLELQRTTAETKLILFTKGQHFHQTKDVGTNLIQASAYQQYPFGSEVPHPDLVLYSQPRTAPTAFLKVFVGGAFTAVHAKLPGLVGCISGLRVGDRLISLHDRAVWTWNQPTYEIGCYSPCTSQSCSNGGTCMPQFDKGPVTECDCEGTSYQGSSCDQEISFDFSGQDVLLFSNRYPLFMTDFTVEFAFSCSEDDLLDSEETQALVILRNTAAAAADQALVPGDLLAVGLQRDNTLYVISRRSSVNSSSDNSVYSVDLRSINVLDGFRHYLKITVGGEDLLTIEMNGLPLTTKLNTTPSMAGEDASPVALSVGGQDNVTSPADSYQTWQNFVGCISNLRFRTRDRKVFRPFFDYDTQANDTVTFQRIGLPNRTQCSAFQNKDSTAVAHDYFPYQERQRMEAPQQPAREPFAALVQVVPEVDDGSTMKTVGTIAGLVVGGIALAVLFYVYKIANKEPPAAAPKPPYRRVDAAAQGVTSHEAVFRGGDDATVEEGKSLMKNEMEMTESLCAKHVEGKSSSSSSMSSLEIVTETASDKVNDAVEAAVAAEGGSTKPTTEDDAYLQHLADGLTIQGGTEESGHLVKTDQDGKGETQETSKVDGERADEDCLNPAITITVVADNETGEEDIRDSEDYTPDQGNKTEPDDEVANDVMARLGKNELEKSYTKLSESAENIHFDSSLSNSGSTSSSFESLDDTSLDDAEKKRASLRKQKKIARRSGSYSMHDSDSNEQTNPEGKQKTDPTEAAEAKILSASDVEKRIHEKSEEVQVVDAQKFFMSRETNSSPKLPPKEDKN